MPGPTTPYSPPPLHPGTFFSTPPPETQNFRLEKQTETERKERLVSIAGTPPDLLNPPVGCGFGSRCENCMKICNEEQPEQFAVGENHVASCWLLHKDCPPELRGGAK